LMLTTKLDSISWIFVLLW